jgi:hypothetical protein
MDLCSYYILLACYEGHTQWRPSLKNSCYCHFFEVDGGVKVVLVRAMKLSDIDRGW